MLLEVGKLRHDWGLGGTWPPSPPTAHWLPLRAGTGSWEPLCWGTQSRAGAEPQSAARCPGAPKFKGRSLKSRICCSQAQGAASTPPHCLEGVGVQDGPALCPQPWGQWLYQHPRVLGLTPPPGWPQGRGQRELQGPLFQQSQHPALSAGSVWGWLDPLVQVGGSR